MFVCEFLSRKRPPWPKLRKFPPKPSDFIVWVGNFKNIDIGFRIPRLLNYPSPGNTFRNNDIRF